MHEDTDKEKKDAIQAGMYQVVYMSPESLVNNLRWREMLRSEVYSKMLIGLAVDEAHCIPKWYI